MRFQEQPTEKPWQMEYVQCSSVMYFQKILDVSLIDEELRQNLEMKIQSSPEEL